MMSNIHYTLWVGDRETEMRIAKDIPDIDEWVDMMHRVPGVGFAIYKIEESGEEK